MSLESTKKIPIMSISHSPGVFPDHQRVFNVCRERIAWQFETTYFHRGYYRYMKGDDESNMILDEIIRDLEILSGRKIMGLFCNYYRDGQDYAGLHQDSYGADVLTLSLGGSRTCYFYPLNKTKEKLSFELASGDLLYFDQALNAQYKHTIPKWANAQPRISIVAFLI